MEDEAEVDYEDLLNAVPQDALELVYKCDVQMEIDTGCVRAYLEVFGPRESYKPLA